MAVDVTTSADKVVRRYVPDKDPQFESPADAFNVLSKLPNDYIPLGDGRLLGIREWTPHFSVDTISGVIEVTIKGIIRMEKK